MLHIEPTDEWRRAHPGGVIGLLEVSVSVADTAIVARLDDRKREIEADLRSRYAGFARKDFLALPVIAAYDAYYRRFEKTYHVLLQLESIVLKGKNLPSISPLVDANFMAEVQTLVLTAGHDVAKLRAPVRIDVSRTGDSMVQMNGARKEIRAGDMIMRDAGGISCSIIYGQDNRSPIPPSTGRVLYVSYAPAGVPSDALEAQLRKIEENVRLVAPRAVVEQSRLLTA